MSDRHPALAGTRDRIVRAATELFATDGVGNTGVGPICQRAGVTKGVFSHHFPGGKESLVVEVIKRHATRLADLLGAAPPDRSVPDLIAETFAGYADLLEASATKEGCPVAASVVDHGSSSPAVRAAAADAFTTWQHTIVHHANDRLVDSALAELIVAAFEGAILMARADGDAAVLRRVGETLSAHLVAR